MLRKINKLGNSCLKQKHLNIRKKWNYFKQKNRINIQRKYTKSFAVTKLSKGLKMDKICIIFELGIFNIIKLVSKVDKSLNCTYVKIKIIIYQISLIV